MKDEISDKYGHFCELKLPHPIRLANTNMLTVRAALHCINSKDPSCISANQLLNET